MATRNRGGAGRSAAALAREDAQAEARAGARRQAEIRQAEKPTASPRAETLFVWDTTAAPGQIRTHEVIVKKDSKGRIATKSYSLSNDKACEMPAPHALQFLRDDAFVVAATPELEQRDEQRIRPVKARTEHVNVIALSENETIAEWSELSDEALVRRAHAFPTADKPGVEASRAELIVFLTEASRIKKADGDRIADDEDLEGLDNSELDRVFGGGRAKGLDKDLIPGGTRIRPAKPSPS